MKHNFKALDGLRGLSALYVLIHHARLALTQPYSAGLSKHPELYTGYDKLMVYFFSMFRFGHEAVIVFFVLSGFVIHLKYADPNYKITDFKLLTYLKKRVVRIYPTLLVSFIVCILTDGLITLFTGDQYVLTLYSLSRFLFNFFLVPDSPLWGSNYPVWSLKHEWFFYLCYPLLLWLYQKQKLLPILLSIVLFAAYLLHFKIEYIGDAAYTLLIWVLGAMLATIYVQNKNLLKNLPFLILLGLIYPFFTRQIGSPYPWLDVCFGLITVGAITLIIRGSVPKLNSLLISLSWLGTFSYSLYLLHFPILNLVKALVIHYSSSKQLPYHLWYVVLSCIVILPIIYFTYYYTERIAINYKKKAL